MDELFDCDENVGAKDFQETGEKLVPENFVQINISVRVVNIFTFQFGQCGR